MSFYIYQLVELLFLPNTLINLSAINHKLAYKSSTIFTKQLCPKNISACVRVCGV